MTDYKDHYKDQNHVELSPFTPSEVGRELNYVMRYYHTYDEVASISDVSHKVQCVIV